MALPGRSAASTTVSAISPPTNTVGGTIEKDVAVSPSAGDTTSTVVAVVLVVEVLITVELFGNDVVAVLVAVEPVGNDVLVAVGRVVVLLLVGDVVLDVVVDVVVGEVVEVVVVGGAVLVVVEVDSTMVAVVVTG